MDNFSQLIEKVAYTAMTENHTLKKENKMLLSENVLLKGYIAELKKEKVSK